MNTLAVRPIGIFDSGVGGLTVWKELVKTLPEESIIYAADSANCPYGPKSDNEIIQLAEHLVEFLLSLDCKLIVVACNTATAAAIDSLRMKYKVPFVGMEPAVKPAALNTKTGNIGILATEGTFNGRLYKETSSMFTSDKNVYVQVGKGLVELAELNQTDSPRAYQLLSEYLEPMLKKNVDHLVLGCTHYPFFYPVIEKIVGKKMKILDPADAVAKRTQELLKENSLSNNSNKTEYSFYSNGNSNILELLIESITHVKYNLYKFK